VLILNPPADGKMESGRGFELPPVPGIREAFSNEPDVSGPLTTARYRPEQGAVPALNKLLHPAAVVE